MPAPHDHPQPLPTRSCKFAHTLEQAPQERPSQAAARPSSGSGHAGTDADADLLRLRAAMTGAFAVVNSGGGSSGGGGGGDLGSTNGARIRAACRYFANGMCAFGDRCALLLLPLLGVP